MFVCKICGKEFKTLTGVRTHIAQYEKMSIKDYLLKYEPEDCTCPYCGKPKIWVRDHFGKTCGDKECIIKSRVETSLERYGVEQPMLCDSVKKKFKTTIKERYGIDGFYVETNVFKEKSKETKKDKYGDETYVNIEKQKETNLKRYGKPSFFQTDMWKEKNEITCMEKYGTKYYVQTEDIRKKRFKEITYDGLIFNSNDEILFYTFCKKNNIELNCHPNISIKYFDNCGKEHLYFPDFEICGRYIEIKGDHFFNDDGILINPYTNDVDVQDVYKSKYDCMIKENVLIIKSSEVRDEKSLYDILKQEGLIKNK